MSAIGDQVVNTRRGRDGLRGEVVWVYPSGDRVVEWLGGEQTSEDPMSAGTCERGCCAWDDDGAVTRYAEHADCRYCGMEAEGRDDAGRPCCGLCAVDHGLELEPLRSWRPSASGGEQR